MRIDITDSCRSRALRSSWLMLLSRSPCVTGSRLPERCASMDWVITSSPTRLINWSTFSTATRILVDSLAFALGAFGGSTTAGCGWATGGGTTSADGNGLASVVGGVVKLICSGSRTKQSTAQMSSSLAVVSRVTSRLLSVCSGSCTSPRLPSSSSISGISLAFSPVKLTRIPPATAVGAGWATTGGAAGASCCCASSASCRSAWQI